MTAPTAGRTALVTGITGQDGSYLAELLLAKGYRVHGLVRRDVASAAERLERLGLGPLDADGRADATGPDLVLHPGDLGDASRVVALVSEVAPDEIYHLGAPADGRAAFDEPERTADVAGLGTLRLLEAIRACGLDTRFFHASSAEIFGDTPPPQDETTPVRPCTPLGAAKLFAHTTTSTYRRAHDLFAVNGILFDHESPRRGRASVTRTLARSAARIAAGLEQHVALGDLTAVRDRGSAPEYVEAMWRMLQTDEPHDLVLATGVGHSVEDLARLCFAQVGLDWIDHVRFDESRVSPVAVDALVGDPARAADRIGWRATTRLPDLVRGMVEAELAAIDPGAGSGPVVGVAPPIAG